MAGSLYSALSIIVTFEGIVMIITGAMIGLAFGIMPGLGASQAMVLLLPFTYGMDANLAILLFIAIMATASFGGSLPAILINTPGTPANVCTTFDGYPLAQKGEARRAIYISAACCAIGTVLGAALLFAAIPVLRKLVTLFGTTETFWLIIFGIAMISLASKGNTLKGLAAGGIGILISFIGRNYVFAGERFTGGLAFLYDGIPLGAFLIGTFAVSSMIFIGSRNAVVDDKIVKATQPGDEKENKKLQAKEGLLDVYNHKAQVIRGSFIGSFLGIIPAVGGAAASFINYLVARQFSKSPHLFGKGSAEGLIASESANDAKDGGALMPTLSFGIPGDPNTAVLLGVLMLHGVPIGWRLFEHQLDLVIMIILALVFGQIIASILGLSISGSVAKITTMNTYYFVPVVIMFSFIGAYLFRGNIWDVLIVLAAALLAYGLLLFNYPPISMVLGYLLGVEAERTFIMSLNMSRGSYGIFFESYVSLIVIAIIVATFLASTLIKPNKSKAAVKDTGKPEVAYKKDRVAAIFATILSLIAGLFLAFSFTYPENMRSFPIGVASITLLLLVVVVLSELVPKIKAQVLKIGGGIDAFLEGKSQGNGISLQVAFKHLKVIAWLFVFTTAVILLGFLSFPIIVFLYIFMANKKHWLVALVISLVLLSLVILMSYVPAISFWKGAIPELIPNILGGGRLPRFL